MKRLLIGSALCLCFLLSACGTLQVTRVGSGMGEAPVGAPETDGGDLAEASPTPPGDHAATQGSLWQEFRQRIGSAYDEGSETDPGPEDVDETTAGDAWPEEPADIIEIPPTPNPCRPRPDWPTYQVKGGDILSAIARQTGATVSELAQANCLADPDLLRPGQMLYVPKLAQPTPRPSLTPEPGRTVRHLDPTYQLAFDYPANWQDESSEGRRRFGGEDGFVQLEALGAPYDIQVVARNQAEHRLQPYGSEPTIEPLVLSDGREARLVLPSDDQPAGMKDQALLVAPYAEPVTIGGYAYNYLALLADSGHIRDLAASLTLAPPPAAIGIDAFTVSAADLPNGGKKVTFTWRSYGATHAVITSGTARRFAPWWPLEANGEHTVTLEGTILPDPEMTLLVYNAVNGLEAYATTSLAWPCSNGYFFAPAPEYCPRAAPLQTTGAYQSFEGGFMIWVSQPGSALPSIYVFESAGRVIHYPDTWTSDETGGDLDELPPADLLQPERGFGKVWHDNPQVRQALGWATAPEVAYQVTYQVEARESIPGVAYLTLPNEVILRLVDIEWQPFSPDPAQ